MKKGLRVILMAALMSLPVCGFANDDNPVYHETVITCGQKPSKGPHRQWIEGNMPCPEGKTTYSQAIDLNVTGNKGFIKSDDSYTAYNGSWFHVKSYCQFTNNLHPIEGVLVYGVFMNSTYTFKYDEATERLNLDADGNMTKPLRMGVMFLKNDNGYPGEVIYKEEMDVYGTKSEGFAGDVSHGDDQVPVYAFQLNLKEKQRLQEGWVCVYACDTGEKENTAFAIVSDATAKGAGLACLEYEGQTGEIWSNPGSYNFCFTGNPEEYNTQKGLKFTRLLAPETAETSKFAKVRMEVSNYGANPVSDATYELYDGDKLLATEKIPDVIQTGATYKYTFEKRIDCSAEGTHNFTIKNVTPGDGLLADQNLAFSTTNTAGTLCTSRSTYQGAYKYITNVTCGKINRTSDWSNYSNFTDEITDITPGQTLKLTLTKKAAQGDYIKVWVDWNGDGLFDGPGELIGYASSGSIDITIPENAVVKPGKRVMRIVLTDHDGSACETYSYGETEDYTLRVVRPDNTPAMAVDKTEADFGDDVATNPTQTLTIKNEGDTDLTTNYKVTYSLPLATSTTPVYTSPKTPVKLNVAPAAAAARVGIPEATEYNPFVLTYAGSYKGNTGAAYESVDFAHYYPTQVTEPIKGMKINSLDVYVATPGTGATSVRIWKGYKGLQENYQAVAYTQEFTPKADSWNHIVLSEPYTIGDDDLFIGVHFEGCQSSQYLVGVDNGPATIGYGDLMSVNNYQKWWSLAELGSNGNTLIRANVTGQRTPAINWLSIDKESSVTAPGEQTELKLTADPWRLSHTVYDANVVMTTNDPLAAAVTVPVYFDLSSGTVNGMKLIDADADNSTVKITADKKIVVSTGKHVAYIALFTTDGRQLQMNFDTNCVDASTLQRGIYLVKAVLDDETTIKGTVAVK